MQALRRARMAASPAFLRGGFRPFFFGGAVWAVLALAIWMTFLTHGLQLPSAFDPLAWHRHEMLFGFVGAVIAGFLLTTIPNWTGFLPIAGAPLASLFALWFAGRCAVLFSDWFGRLPAAVVDVGFYLALAAVAGREVIAGKNRNLPVVLLVLLLGAANGVDHAAAAGLIADPMMAMRFAIGLVVLIISLVGGRIVPSFTRNWMTKRGIRDGLPGQPGRFDLATLAVTGLALAAWAALAGAPTAAWLLALAAAMQAVRLARWRGWRTAADPLVLVLHVGYLWIPMGLGLLAIAILVGHPTVSVAVHALTAGGMATMILAVMTRSSLSHTGRPLVASRATIAAYVLVTAGAVLRVSAPLLFANPFVGLEGAALLWGSAFAVFTVVYGRILFAG
jgi:uncharacterized protein involved in response to NO